MVDDLQTHSFDIKDSKKARSMPSLDKIGIHVEVTDPEKHGDGLDAYCTYKVATWTTWKNFQSESFFVRRRYNDFDWLKNEINKKYPHLITPPLPDRHRLEYLDRFNPDFLERRRRALEKFLMRIAQHPGLRNEPAYHQFLEAKSWALPVATGQSKAQATLDDVAVFVKNAIAPKAKRPLEALENTRNYINDFESSLATIDKLMTTMLKHKTEIALDQTELAAALLLLGNSEKALTQPLQNIASAFDLSSNEMETMVSAEDTSFVDPLKEYVMYGKNIRKVQQNVDNLHVIYETNLIALEQARAEKVELEAERDDPNAASAASAESKPAKSSWANFMSKVEAIANDVSGIPPAQARADKISKLDMKIATLEQSLEENKRNHEQSMQTFIAEIDRFNTDKIYDFKKMLLDFVNDQVTHSKNSLSAWEAGLQSIASIDPTKHALSDLTNA